MYIKVKLVVCAVPWSSDDHFAIFTFNQKCVYMYISKRSLRTGRVVETRLYRFKNLKSVFTHIWVKNVTRSRKDA